MHAKSGLRVVLKWKLFRPDSVIADVIRLLPTVTRSLEYTQRFQCLQIAPALHAKIERGTMFALAWRLNMSSNDTPAAVERRNFDQSPPRRNAVDYFGSIAPLDSRLADSRLVASLNLTCLLQLELAVSRGVESLSRYDKRAGRKKMVVELNLFMDDGETIQHIGVTEYHARSNDEPIIDDEHTLVPIYSNVRPKSTTCQLSFVQSLHFLNRIRNVIPTLSMESTADLAFDRNADTMEISGITLEL